MRNLAYKLVNKFHDSMGHESILEIDEMHEISSNRSKLFDFGSQDYLPGLETLHKSVTEEANLNYFGRKMFNNQCLDLLESRLTICSTNLPIDPTNFAEPIVIAGLPRTGSTILHFLLNECCHVNTIKTWQQKCTPRLNQNQLKELSRQNISSIQKLNPSLKSLHPIKSYLPQECILGTAGHFRSMVFEATYNIPTYQEWLLASDSNKMYKFHNLVLDHYDSESKSNWLLKYAGHGIDLDGLLLQYPKAKIIYTHRPAEAIINSTHRLMSSFYTKSSKRYSNQDNFKVLNNAINIYTKRIEKLIHHRSDLITKENKMIDINFTSIVSNPYEQILRIAEELNLELKPNSENLCRNFLNLYPSKKHKQQNTNTDRIKLNSVLKKYNEQIEGINNL